MTKRMLTVAAIQTSYGPLMAANIAKTESFIREAARQGAQVVLPSELFQGIYFCTQQDPQWFATAYPAAAHPCVLALKALAAELRIAIPISFFEKDGPNYYNSVAVADADGEILGVYRKSHIPDGPGYQEKYYFRPGDTGFKAWRTRYGTIGVGICWDQWFPEAARAMVLAGAEVLFYPAAIGSEPYDAALDTHKPWQRAMQGHAVSNAVPIVAANRVGTEENAGAVQRFYGHSFIADHTGELVQSFGEAAEGVLVHTFDLAEIERYRAEWGFFRDRRPDLYAKSLEFDKNFAQELRPQTQEIRQEPDAPHPKSVLLIEDDDATARSVELMAFSEGFNLSKTGFGEKGIDLAKSYAYDIILLDLGLTGVSGFEVIKTLRVHEVKTPILVFSEWGGFDENARALRLGADDCLCKRFHKDELAARIHAIIRREEYRDPMEAGEASGRRVLLVEDDIGTAQSIELVLLSEGFNVCQTDLGENGIDLAKSDAYDIILLDLGLPDISGFEVIKSVRVHKVKTPILVLSGFCGVDEKVRALRFGADDYLCKPFHKDELAARTHAIMRRRTR